MKKFVELIQRVHNERFSVVMNKIAAEKIPVAFLSLAPIDAAVEIVKNLRGQGLNISKLITLQPPPADSELDFDIIHLSDAAKIYPRLEYVLVIDDVAARVAVKNLPNSKVLSINRGDTEHIYQVFMNHLSDLQDVYESLIDEESKKTFCGYWFGNISNRIGEIVYSSTPHYILSGFIPEKDAVIIDGGAYDGGTATIFSAMGCRVYGFEIDKISFETAKKVAAEKNFVIENCGLGSYKHEMRYTPSGSYANHFDAGGSDITQVTTIDAYARENNLPSVDFIKLDVEGAELDTLKGAKISIARFKPILALSAYHKLEDFWTLMNFIKSIRPDYEFAMRQYPETAEDVPLIFNQGRDEIYVKLGIEPELRKFDECVLFAR